MHLMTTENSILLCWLLSAVMSSMPQPKADASYWIVWLHNMSQFVAANPYKMIRPSQPVSPAQPKEV